jgi:hypothetical protein
MGPHRAAWIIASLLLAPPALAQSPGWGFSHVPGEGDRAAIGCSRDSTPQDHTCLVVRCEDDFSTGIHVLSSRPGGAAGIWEMTLDREAINFRAFPSEAPYSARFAEEEGRLLERLRFGTFAYLRHEEDAEAGFAFISLAGSMAAIAEALYFCAPRIPALERNKSSDVEAGTIPNGEKP